MEGEGELVPIVGKVARQLLGHGQAVGGVDVLNLVHLIAARLRGQHGIVNLQLGVLGVGGGGVDHPHLEQIDRRGGQTRNAVVLLGQAVVVYARRGEFGQVKVHGNVTVRVGNAGIVHRKGRRDRAGFNLVSRAQLGAVLRRWRQITLLRGADGKGNAALYAARAGGIFQADALFKGNAGIGDRQHGGLDLCGEGRGGHSAGEQRSGKYSRKSDCVHKGGSSQMCG